MYPKFYSIVLELFIEHLSFVTHWVFENVIVRDCRDHLGMKSTCVFAEELFKHLHGSPQLPQNTNSREPNTLFELIRYQACKCSIYICGNRALTCKIKTNPLKWHCIWSDTFYSINVYKKAINTFSKSKTTRGQIKNIFYLFKCLLCYLWCI